MLSAEGEPCACARPPPCISRYYKGQPGSAAGFSLQRLDRTEARSHCTAEEMEDKEKKKKDKHSDRVTLKKEIGLLSACAIIIGECVSVCDGSGAEPGRSGGF